MGEKGWEHKFLSVIFAGLGTNTGAYVLINYLNGVPPEGASAALTIVFLWIAWTLWRMG